jgi:hypothetical protein
MNTRILNRAIRTNQHGQSPKWPDSFDVPRAWFSMYGNYKPDYPNATANCVGITSISNSRSFPCNVFIVKMFQDIIFGNMDCFAL